MRLPRRAAASDSANGATCRLVMTGEIVKCARRAGERLLIHKHADGNCNRQSAELCIRRTSVAALPPFRHEVGEKCTGIVDELHGDASHYLLQF